MNRSCTVCGRTYRHYILYLPHEKLDLGLDPLGSPSEFDHCESCLREAARLAQAELNRRLGGLGDVAPDTRGEVSLEE
jgi:hypothetical protein